MQVDLDPMFRTAGALAITYGARALGAALILVAGWAVARIAARAVRRALERGSGVDRTLVPVAAQLARYGVIAITLVAVLAQFGVQTASIVAVLGAAGLAVGLALQGTLGNVAAGIMLLFLRPFSADEVVEIGGLTARVEEVGIFVTRLRRLDGVPVSVPNGQIWGQEIKNFSRTPVRRIELKVGIGYGDDIGKALRVAREVLDADPRVVADPEPLVAVGDLGDSSVNLLIWPWTKNDDWWATKLDLTRALKERFDSEGITIPFPQRAVHHHVVRGEREPTEAGLALGKGLGE